MRVMRHMRQQTANGLHNMWRKLAQCMLPCATQGTKGPSSYALNAFDSNMWLDCAVYAAMYNQTLPHKQHLTQATATA